MSGAMKQELSIDFQWSLLKLSRTLHLKITYFFLELCFFSFPLHHYFKFLFFSLFFLFFLFLFPLSPLIFSFISVKFWGLFCRLKSSWIHKERISQHHLGLFHFHRLKSKNPFVHITNKLVSLWGLCSWIHLSNRHLHFKVLHSSKIKYSKYLSWFSTLNHNVFTTHSVLSP